MPHHDPWTAFAALTTWTLVWRHLPDGYYGFTNFLTRTVTLHNDLTQAERRCTIAHETEHILRGPIPSVDRMEAEELAVNKAASRKLIEVHTMAEALAHATDTQEAADALWVDLDMLNIRLHHLHPAERAFIKRRLAQDRVNGG